MRYLKILIIKIYHFISGNNLQNWKDINFNVTCTNIKDKKNILIATSSGGLRSQLVLESIIGKSLKYKGCNVEFLLCDGELSSCIMSTCYNISESELTRKGTSKLCFSCFNLADDYLKNADLFVNKFSEYFYAADKIFIENLKKKKFDLENIKNYTIENINIGQHAYAGALRYYAKTDIKNELKFIEILNHYFISAVKSYFIIRNLLKNKKFDDIIINHGIYVPQGVITEVAKKENINISTWCPGYRKNSFCFTKGDTYHRSLITEKNSNWENIFLNKKLESKIDTYLKSRIYGSHDWIYFHDNPDFNAEKFLYNQGFDPSKPAIGLATNVIWDAQIDYPTNFFSNMLEWIFCTIDFFIKNPKLQLIIRVHPAEINETKPSKQKVVNEILKKYSNLPKNIFLIPPEKNISTYSIFDKCQSVIIYGTKMGIELAAQGKPVIVCGEAFIRNKSIAIDIKSKKHYADTLKNIQDIDSKTFKLDLIRAKKYAYHFFFRRTVELNSIIERPGKWPNFEISHKFVKNLKLKKDKGLESICDSIINSKDFIFEDEKYS